MATDRQIATAARGRGRPPIVDRLNDSALLSMIPGRLEAEAAERAAAHRKVRRMANRHGCPGHCDRPEHAADVAAALDALEALGLKEF